MSKILIIFISIALFAYACGDIIEQPNEEKDRAVQQHLHDTEQQQQHSHHHNKKHHGNVEQKHQEAQSEGTKLQHAGKSVDDVTKVDSDEVHANRHHRPVKGQKGEHKSHRSRKIGNRNKHRRGHGHGEKQQRKPKHTRQQTGGKPKNRSHNMKRNRHHSH